MTTNRDDFTRPTKEILAKRVGYLCSHCSKPTIGANENINKITIIGVAAHITAASSGGPRYDDTMQPEQRRNIDNGIWLCSNCATLIDKDSQKYTVDIIRQWKINAEEESRKRLNGEIMNQPLGSPYLEVDLLWQFSSRSPRGYSNKNPIEMHEGRPVIVVGNNPIIYWAISRNFNFSIYNNSNHSAFNLKLESIGEMHFSEIDSLPKINNLPPLQNIDLKAKYEDFVEGDYTVADKILRSKVPEKFKDIKLKLTYNDEVRKVHTNYIEFADSEIINTKL